MKSVDDQKFAKLFGEFVRDSRGLKKVSQQELADQLEISQSYLSKIEQGVRSVDFELAVRICSFLNRDLNDFLIQTKSD